MQLCLQRHGEGAIYRQIVNQIRDQILSGTLAGGTRLPAVRELAAEQGLTRLTVHSAYSELQSMGLVEAHVGRGTFVCDTAARRDGEFPVEQPAPGVRQSILAELLRMGEGRSLLSFAQAFPAPETYPARELEEAVHLALAEPASLGYGPIQGDLHLRRQLSGLLFDRGLTLSPEHILITAGAQQGIDLALRALTEPEDVLLVEDPVYPGILELASLRGQRVIGIPNAGGELDIDALETACATHHPRLLYLVPSCSNPTGRTLGAASRAAVLRLAGVHDFLVIEDDTYGLLGFDGIIPPALKSGDDGERVVYLTTFSKTLAPAFRLGALTASSSLLPALAAVKQSSDLVCSMLLQRALAGYLQQGRLEGHLRTVRAVYSARRDAMVAALARYLPQCSWTAPEGGLSLWVRLPAGISESEFTADALRRGIGIAPGSAFHAQPPRSAAVRLCFGAHTVERIEEGITVLGSVLDDHRQRRTEMLSLAGGAGGPLV